VSASRIAPWALPLCVVIAAASVVLLAVGPEQPAEADIFAGVGGASFLVLSLTFASVGAMVAARVPDNRIGWVFCAIGVLCGMSVLAWVYADYGLNATSDVIPWRAAGAVSRLRVAHVPGRPPPVSALAARGRAARALDGAPFRQRHRPAGCAG
jgi:hypothetical protein